MRWRAHLRGPERRTAGEINGRLMHECEFFGGILGHLDQGGTFDVRQERVGGDYWEIERNSR